MTVLKENLITFYIFYVKKSCLPQGLHLMPLSIGSFSGMNHIELNAPFSCAE